MPESARPHVHRINVSAGGVPKTRIPETRVTPTGLAEDSHTNTRSHGGPTRAVCLLGLDVIERLRAEGHPIGPGTTGENLTIAGVDWGAIGPGTHFRFEGGVILEALSYASPCNKIRASFADGRIEYFDAGKHPENARIYARVVAEGVLREGAAVVVEAAP